MPILGRQLLSTEFSGGNQAGQANYTLRKLGFEVVRKGDSNMSVSFTMKRRRI